MKTDMKLILLFKAIAGLRILLENLTAEFMMMLTETGFEDVIEYPAESRHKRDGNHGLLP